MRLLNACAASACIAATVSAVAAEAFTGRFAGTGRACDGLLTVTGTKISWVTPFSRCGATTYRVIERNEGRVTFVLAYKGAECRYRVLSLTHRPGEGPDLGWNVTGHSDKVSYREHQASGYSSHPPDMLSCYLIRDPAPSRPSR